MGGKGVIALKTFQISWLSGGRCKPTMIFEARIGDDVVAGALL
jgi:hypothetical protein